jgi:hypothetical protein
MDADRFDTLSRTVITGLGRRRVLRALLGGTLTALLAKLETEARPKKGRRKGHTRGGRRSPVRLRDHGHGRRRGDGNRPSDVSAEKRRKKKKKKKATPSQAASAPPGAPPPPPVPPPSPPPPPPKGGDEAPPCTAESCPLPPGCSRTALDACATALREAVIAEAEPCRQVCQDPTSTVCRDCLTPLVAATLPEAEECVALTCGLPLPPAGDAVARSVPSEQHRATVQAVGEVGAEAWWERKCQTATCCYLDHRECAEDARDEWLICMAGAMAGCVIGGPLCAAAALACMGKLAHDVSRCDARHGCLNGGTCHPGDICCPDSMDILCNGQCCHKSPGLKDADVCCNGQCCARGRTCCNGECRETGSGPWTACGDTCCRGDQECCNGQCRAREQGPWTACGATCCRGGEECCKGQCRPVGSVPCGDKCCWGDEVCCNGVCREKGSTPCGETCCAENQNCCNGACYLKEWGEYSPCGDTCCPEGDICCKGHCYAADAGPWIPCGHSCIDGNVYQCCGGEIVCWKDSKCCGDYCCPGPYRCCEGTCCFS